jgi:transposase
MDRPLTLKDREARRLLAVERVNQGYSQTDVAAFLGVSDRAVRYWMKAYRARGRDGLRSPGHPGRPVKLSPGQVAEVLSWFRQSPTAFGYATHLWTAARVAALIRDRLGVSFNPRYLSGWLADRGVTPQRPQPVPKQRDQNRIDAWVRDVWPRILKKGAPNGPTSSWSTRPACS